MTTSPDGSVQAESVRALPAIKTPAKVLGDRTSGVGAGWTLPLADAGSPSGHGRRCHVG